MASFWSALAKMESLCCGMAIQVTGLEHLMDTRVQSGQHVLILQHSMLLQLLQTSARDELHSFEHKHIVRTCAFSESTTHLLTGGSEKVLRIFDLNRPDAPPTLLEGSSGTPIRAAVWHHSDQTILSSSNDIGGVRVWDVRTKAIVRTLETKLPCTSVEVSRDGNYVTTADGNTVKFWDAHHFGLVNSYTMPMPVESASLFPSRSKFIAGGDDMWVRLFDSTTGDEIECNKGHHGPVHCVRFSPGGESYASGSEDGTIRIWCTVSGTDEFEVGSFGNGDVKQIRVGVDEVVRKVEGFHIAQENGSNS
ncbi:hypothetical protein CY35_11G105500 [Sphagnum magellanicum]|nr:hypothetical protein CY35_11G105500 [Sphagnum magellanicum]